MLNKTVITSQVNTIAIQRNEALNQVAALAGELAMRDETIATLREKLAEAAVLIRANAVGLKAAVEAETEACAFVVAGVSPATNETAKCHAAILARIAPELDETDLEAAEVANA